ncbi:hypothetical protein [Haematobacter missouriensis]|uniref:hypothetical protein n=1 Tax=Haematobacter missouriensis TaxID=366616 RepID=UPI00117B79A0|nr:hypothetical protein [Haematobacter missouriensis]
MAGTAGSSNVRFADLHSYLRVAVPSTSMTLPIALDISTALIAQVCQGVLPRLTLSTVRRERGPGPRLLHLGTSINPQPVGSKDGAFARRGVVLLHPTLCAKDDNRTAHMVIQQSEPLLGE